MTKTFLDFDKFGLEPFAEQLTAYLKIESKFVEESYVMSLNSEFGSGKSTFFEMWANKLKAADAPFKVVYINAWESDFQGDPLLAIVSYLLDILKPSKDIETIKETAGKLGKFALCIGNDVVQRFTGVDVIKAGQYAESKDGIAKPEIGHACFQLYQERQKLFEELKTLLRNLTRDSKKPILIIVDELDRSRPSYAIEFLETIKHFFDISGLIFVIGVDKTQLASSAKALFGQQLDFNEYYRKFAHRHVNLPVNSKPMTEKFCREVVKEYLSEEAFEKKKRFSYAQNDRFRVDDVVELCLAFSLNARQMHEFFRTTAHVLSATKKPDAHLLWGLQIGAFFITALSIKNPDFYHKIGKQEISLSDFTEFLKELALFNNKSDRNTFWWAILLYMVVFSDQPSEKLEQELHKLGVWDPSVKKGRTFQDELEGFSRGLPRLNSPAILVIYQTLEGLKTFA